MSRRLSASIGSFSNNRFADFRYFNFLQEVENDLVLLRPLAVDLLRGVDDDLLDELVHDGRRQLRDVHVRLHQGEELVNIVLHFLAGRNPVLKTDDLVVERRLLRLVALQHLLVTLPTQIAEYHVLIDTGDECVDVRQPLLRFSQPPLVLPDGFLLFFPPAHQPVLLKAFHICPDIFRHGPDTFQHYIPQNVLPDIVGRTGSPSAFVLGADVVVLLAVKVFTGGEVELAPAVGADHQPGEHPLPLSLDRAALVLTKLLHSVPLFFRHDGLLRVGQNEHVRAGIGDALLALIGLGVGFEIADATGVLHPLQNADNRLLHPVIGALRQQAAFPPGVQRLGGQNLVRFQNPGNLARPLSGNRQVKDTLDHRRGIIVNNPVVAVIRVKAIAIRRLAHVFTAGASGFQNGANLFAGIFCIKIVKNIANYGKIVVSLGAVHRVIHGDKARIVAGKNDFRIPANLQIVSAKSAHIFDDPGSKQTLFHQRKPLLDTGTIEVRSGVPVVNQHLGIREAMGRGVAAEDASLTLDFWRDNVTYEGKSMPTGTLACAALNLPDEAIAKLSQLCMPLNLYMGPLQLGLANTEQMKAARESAFQIVELLRNVPPFSFLNYEVVRSYVDIVFSEDYLHCTTDFVKSNNLELSTTPENQKAVTLLRVLPVMAHLGFSLAEFKRELLPFAEKLHESDRTPDGYAASFGQYFSLNPDMSADNPRWMSLANASVQYAAATIPGEEKPQLVKRMHYVSFVGMFRSELFEGLCVGHAPRKCPICGTWFLTTDARPTKYCGGPASGDKHGRTCRQVGNLRGREQRERADDHPLKKIYERRTNTIIQKPHRGTMDEKAAAVMKRLAKNKLERAIADREYAAGPYEAEMTQEALLAEAQNYLK